MDWRKSLTQIGCESKQESEVSSHSQGAARKPAGRAVERNEVQPGKITIRSPGGRACGQAEGAWCRRGASRAQPRTAGLSDLQGDALLLQDGVTVMLGLVGTFSKWGTLGKAFICNLGVDTLITQTVLSFLFQSQ